MSELTEKSQRLRREAESFYEKSPLKALLPKFGSVHFRGSFDLDLMSKRDLDIYVISPDIDRRTVMQAFNEIANEEFFYGYYLFDRKKFPKDGMPKAYYIGLKGNHNERMWKVDIWFMTEEDEPSRTVMNFVKENLDESSKETILKLKQYRDENNLDISGKDIYVAVLKDGINNEQDMLKHLNIQK